MEVLVFFFLSFDVYIMYLQYKKKEKGNGVMEDKRQDKNEYQDLVDQMNLKYNLSMNRSRILERVLKEALIQFVADPNFIKLNPTEANWILADYVSEMKGVDKSCFLDTGVVYRKPLVEWLLAEVIMEEGLVKIPFENFAYLVVNVLHCGYQQFRSAIMHYNRTTENVDVEVVDVAKLLFTEYQNWIFDATHIRFSPRHDADDKVSGKLRYMITDCDYDLFKLNPSYLAAIIDTHYPYNHELDFNLNIEWDNDPNDGPDFLSKHFSISPYVLARWYVILKKKYRKEVAAWMVLSCIINNAIAIPEFLLNQLMLGASVPDEKRDKGLTCISDPLTMTELERRRVVKLNDLITFLIKLQVHESTIPNVIEFLSSYVTILVPNDIHGRVDRLIIQALSTEGKPDKVISFINMHHEFINGFCGSETSVENISALCSDVCCMNRDAAPMMRQALELDNNNLPMGWKEDSLES